LSALYFQPGFIQAMGLDRTAAVISNADIFEPEITRRFYHFRERIVPVAGSSMTVERATQVLPVNQWRQISRFCCFEFAAVLPQLRWNEIESEGAIKPCFIGDWRNLKRQRLPFPGRGLRRGGQAIFIECPAPIESAVSHHNVVLLAARKII